MADLWCWCGGVVGPREPGDLTGLGCLADINHDWRAATYDIVDVAAELEYAAKELANACEAVKVDSRYSEGYRDALDIAEQAVRSRANAVRSATSTESEPCAPHQGGEQ